LNFIALTYWKRARQVIGAAIQVREEHPLVVRGQGRLRLALPWLEAVLGAAAAEGRAPVRAPAAEWLASRGTARAATDRSWREWLMAGTDAGAALLQQFPAGPSLRALHAAGAVAGAWACARPVHLLTAIDHLQLAPGGVDITEAESALLLRDLNRHLEGRGLRFHVEGPADDWLLECQDPIDCRSFPPDEAEGRNLRELMPRGPDGARVCSFMNEIQMLLHEHPVNVERAALRRPVINSLWIWGFGQAREAKAIELPALYTDDEWLSGIWRLHGAAGRSLEEFAAGDPGSAGDVLVAWSRTPRGIADEALADADRRCFAPSLAALRSGAVRAVDVLTGERAFEADSRARLRFWRRERPLAEAIA
jgi:hypothetical protein